MRIGLLTYHYAFNFGAVLQAYALKEFLTAHGHYASFINYQNNEVVSSYKLFRFRKYSHRNPCKFLRQLFRDIYVFKKYQRFQNLVNCLLDINNEYTNSKIDLHDYDTIIIGSDQLWNKKITAGYDRMYCAFFKNDFNAKTIGYAISMNTKSLSEEDREELISILKNFDHVSVREFTTARLLESITTKNVKEVLDPTLLVDRSFWLSKIVPVPPKNYICVYAILNADKLIAEARIIARKLKKELVILDPVASWTPFQDYLKIENPMMFVSYIAHADLVLTSSFHGTAFSVIFHKNFYVMGDDDKNIRMSSFLSSLGLSNRIVNYGYLDINQQVDYSKVEQILNVQREHSKNFLFDSINN